MSFYSFCSNDSFLLYFIKVLIHNGSKFIEFIKNEARGLLRRQREKHCPESLALKAFLHRPLPPPHLPDPRQSLPHSPHTAALPGKHLQLAFSSLTRNE